MFFKQLPTKDASLSYLFGCTVLQARGGGRLSQDEFRRSGHRIVAVNIAA